MKFMELLPGDSAYLTSLVKKLAAPLGENLSLWHVVEYSVSSFSDSVVCGAGDPVCGTAKHQSHRAKKVKLYF